MPNGLFQKKSKRRVEDILFWKAPLEILDHLHQEILEKKSVYPWKFCKFACHPLEIPKSNQDPWKFCISFSWHPCNFHFFFNWTLEFPRFFFETPGNSMSSTPPVWIFFGIAQCMFLHQYPKKFGISTFPACFLLELPKHQTLSDALKQFCCYQYWRHLWLWTDPVIPRFLSCQIAVTKP